MNRPGLRIFFGSNFRLIFSSNTTASVRPPHTRCDVTPSRLLRTTVTVSADVRRRRPQLARQYRSQVAMRELRKPRHDNTTRRVRLNRSNWRQPPRFLRLCRPPRSAAPPSASRAASRYRSRSAPLSANSICRSHKELVVSALRRSIVATPAARNSRPNSIGQPIDFNLRSFHPHHNRHRAVRRILPRLTDK